jgi:hypothetical protein
LAGIEETDRPGDTFLVATVIIVAWAKKVLRQSL